MTTAPDSADGEGSVPPSAMSATCCAGSDELLLRARDLTTPLLRSGVDTLPGTMRQVFGYHPGWWDKDGTPATRGQERPCARHWRWPPLARPGKRTLGRYGPPLRRLNSSAFSRCCMTTSWTRTRYDATGRPRSGCSVPPTRSWSATRCRPWPARPRRMRTPGGLRGRTVRGAARGLRLRAGGRRCGAVPGDGPLRIAVMGCVVNGPGEAREADLDVSCGNGRGQIFIATVPESRIVDALLEEALTIVPPPDTDVPPQHPSQERTTTS
ncbi:hypothetical protein ABH941_007407 [Streptacidiphilus sp. EB103A]